MLPYETSQIHNSNWHVSRYLTSWLLSKAPHLWLNQRLKGIHTLRMLYTLIDLINCAGGRAMTRCVHQIRAATGKNDDRSIRSLYCFQKTMPAQSSREFYRPGCWSYARCRVNSAMPISICLLVVSLIYLVGPASHSFVCFLGIATRKQVAQDSAGSIWSSSSKVNIYHYYNWY